MLSAIKTAQSNNIWWSRLYLFYRYILDITHYMTFIRRFWEIYNPLWLDYSASVGVFLLLRTTLLYSLDVHSFCVLMDTNGHLCSHPFSHEKWTTHLRHSHIENDLNTKSFDSWAFFFIYLDREQKHQASILLTYAIIAEENNPSARLHCTTGI